MNGSPPRPGHTSYDYRSKSPSHASVGGGGNSNYPLTFYALRLMLAFVSIISFGLAMAHIFTNVITKDGVQNWIRWGLWEYKWCPRAYVDSEYCVTSDMPMDMCVEWKDRQRTMQAFSIIVVVWSFISSVFCWSDFFGFSDTARLPSGVALATVLILSVFSLIQWAVMAGSFNRNICGMGALNDNHYRLSASFSLALCIFFSTITSSIVYIFVRYVKPKWN